MDGSAVKASFGRGIETVNQAEGLALQAGDVVEDAHELTTGQVANLAAPHGLHPLHGEVFKEERIVAVGQGMGQLKEPVTALVDHGLIQAGDGLSSFLPMVRKLDLACHLALGLFQFGEGLPIEQRAFNRFAVRCGEKSFQPKVEACAITCLGLMGLGDFFLDHKVQIEIAKTVTFDGDGLDASRYLTALAEFVDLALNADTVIVQQLPTGLLEGERAILLNLLKAWWGRAYFPFQVGEKQTIGVVDTVNNILNGLNRPIANACTWPALSGE